MSPLCDDSAPLEKERQISPSLSAFIDYQLIENTVFNFQEFPNGDSELHSEDFLDLSVQDVIEKQKWTSSTFQDRNMAHMLMCEVALSTIETSRFDEFFGLQEELSETSDPEICETILVNGRTKPASTSFDSCPSSSGDNKSVQSDSHNQVKEEHLSETFNHVVEDRLSVDDSVATKSRSSNETPTPNRSRVGAFCFSESRSSHSSNHRAPVSKEVMLVYPHVCPSELTLGALKCVDDSSLGTTLRDLNIIFRQNEQTLEDIKDRISWNPIVGNERVVEVCDKPSNAFKFIKDKQGFRCAFCGLKTDGIRFVAFQFCFYYGRYGCNTCVTGKSNIIPARIIFQWDFRTFPVSNMAKEFIEKTEFKPIYNPRVLCPRFLESGKMGCMSKIEELRLKISHVMECIDACSEHDAVKYKAKIRSHFHRTRTHLFHATGNYSLQDFVEISSTRVDNMEHYLKQILAQTKYHCERCEAQCRRKYRPCLLCKDASLVYPWNIDYVVSCENCQHLLHKKCADNRKSGVTCPKCKTSFVTSKISNRLTGITSNSPNSVC